MAPLPAKQVSVIISGDQYRQLVQWHQFNAVTGTLIQDSARTLLAAAMAAPEMSFSALRSARTSAYKNTRYRVHNIFRDALLAAEAEFRLEMSSTEEVDAETAGNIEGQLLEDES